MKPRNSSHKAASKTANICIVATLALVLAAGCPGGSRPDDAGQTEHLNTDAGPAAIDTGGTLDAGGALDGGATAVENDAGSPDAGITGPPPWADAGTCVGPPFVAQGGVVVEFCDIDEDCAYRNQDTYRFGCVFELNAGHKACQLVDSCVTDDDCAADAGQSCRIDSYGFYTKRCMSECSEELTPCGSAGFLGKMGCVRGGIDSPLWCVAGGRILEDDCSEFSPSYAAYVCVTDDGDGPGNCGVRCEP